MDFTEEYYKTGNYVDYLTRGSRYVRMTEELHEFLTGRGLLHRDSRILDYGCAIGFLMEGFLRLGYTRVVGFDISPWATAEARKKGLSLLAAPRGEYDLACYLDVLEHMDDAEINEAFQRHRSRAAIVRIPCSTDGRTFHLEVSRRDQTHINCRTKDGWRELLGQQGYTSFEPLSLATIWDSPGVMSCLCLKT